MQKKKKTFNKRFTIALHKSSIYRNQIKSSSREFQFVQILLNFPHRAPIFPQKFRVIITDPSIFNLFIAFEPTIINFHKKKKKFSNTNWKTPHPLWLIQRPEIPSLSSSFERLSAKSSISFVSCLYWLRRSAVDRCSWVGHCRPIKGRERKRTACKKLKERKKKQREETKKEEDERRRRPPLFIWLDPLPPSTVFRARWKLVLGRGARNYCCFQSRSSSPRLHLQAFSLARGILLREERERGGSVHACERKEEGRRA